MAEKGVTVQPDYHDDEKMFIRHRIEIKGISKEVEKEILEKEFQNCLVKKNLSKEIVFEIPEE